MCLGFQQVVDQAGGRVETDPFAVTQVGDTYYEYDANGNMTDRGSQELTWDAENRLVTVSDNGTATYFWYDGDGNRVKKIEGGIETLYINRYFEVNLTASTNTSYYYLGGSLIAMSANGTLEYVHQDHLSGTSLMTGTEGASLGMIKYMPFGETRAGDVPTDRLFTGQRLDGTGLYYYNARYYDPAIGRFISADTLVPGPANPQSFNRYSYCLNNPLKYTDPSGHLVYDENGTPIDTSDPYWIENYVFSGGSLEDILTPTTAAWCDFVWSSDEYTVALAHALERDQNTIVNLKYSDLGYRPDSTFRRGSNENEYTIILNNNIYNDISKVNAFYRSGAILDQIYNVVGVPSFPTVHELIYLALFEANNIVSKLPDNKILGAVALGVGIPLTLAAGSLTIAGIVPGYAFGEVNVMFTLELTAIGAALWIYGWNTVTGNEFKIYDGPMPLP